MSTSCYSVFKDLLQTLCLQEFPCGYGSWRNPQESFSDGQYAVTTKDYGVQYEKMETLKEYLRSGTWDVDTSWSCEARELQNIAVVEPWKLADAKGKKVIHQFFRNLRIIDKEVTEIDKGMLLLKNLENLTLSVNLLKEIPAENLPTKLKVLELCTNCLESISSLCNNPPPLEHLGLSHNQLYSQDEYKYFTASYWPSLLSLDLSYNNLTHLVELIDKAATLPNLRSLVLQGNPLSLVPGYRGYTLDVLRDLILFDDANVTADEKHHFKGLSRKKELVLDESQFIVSVETLGGVPPPEEKKENEEGDGYPIVSTRYYVEYDMIKEQPSPPPLLEVVEDTSQSPPTVVETQPSDQLPVEQSRDQVDQSPPSKMGSFATSDREWAGFMNMEHKREYYVNDLVEFRDFILKGITLKVFSKTVRSWPAASAQQEDAPQMGSPGTDRRKSGSRRKSGKEQDLSKKEVKEKAKEKGGKSAKDKGKKKGQETPIDLRSDPPEITEIGSHTVSLNFFLEGETLVDDILYCGGGPMTSKEEVVNRQQAFIEALERTAQDTKNLKKRKTPPNSSRNKSGTGKKKDGKKVEHEEHAEEEPPPPKPITLKVRIELKKWKTAMDCLQEREL